ncbi:MAG: septum formation initiator family protein [Desulfuromonadaceae bacterium]|nr:septum formation initiator family protein [Desulfuromonadaceae bacterium]
MTQPSELAPSAWWKLPWWAILIVAAFLAMALFGERGVLRVVDVSRQRDMLQQEIARLSEKNDRLAEEIRGLRSDRRFIEDIARRDLRMARENEIIYVFPPQGKAVTIDGPAL